MNLIQEFLNQIGFNISVDCEDIAHKTDDSSLDYGDGDEGDYGTIRYYGTATGDLIALNTVSGDDEDVDFTKYGASLLKSKCHDLINAHFEKMVKDRMP